MIKLTFLLLFIFFGFLIAKGQNNNQDIKLPSIGKWLTRPDGEPANWMGKKYQNKELREPINIVIVDEHSTSREQAIAKLMNECKRHGYKEKMGHSSGYFGEIDSTLFPEIPNQKKKAFANKTFIKTNNHGRIMGPDYYDGKYVFVASFSRESFKLLDRVHHIFRSFTIARNDFCNKLTKGNTYKVVGQYYLGNEINSKEMTTGDHDGEAILLFADK